MADLTPVIETLENRWMRAWVQRDAKALKSLTARNFMLLMGSTKPTILDARSWVEAATTRYLCMSYRFGDVYVRDVGGFAIFASNVELKATMDGVDWSGRFWVTDIWKKGRVRRGWGLAQRVVSLPTTIPRSRPESALCSSGVRHGRLSPVAAASPVVTTALNGRTAVLRHVRPSPDKGARKWSKHRAWT